MRKSKLFLLEMLGILLAFSLLLTGCNPGTRAAGTWSAAFTTGHGTIRYDVTLRITNQGWEYRATRSVAAGQWERTSVPVGVARGTIIRWQGDNGELITDGGHTFGSVERLNQNSMRIRVGFTGSPLMLSRSRNVP